MECKTAALSQYWQTPCLTDFCNSCSKHYFIYTIEETIYTLSISKLSCIQSGVTLMYHLLYIANKLVILLSVGIIVIKSF